MVVPKLAGNFQHNIQPQKTFFKKIHSRGNLSKHYTSRALYIPLHPLRLQIFSTKPLKRWIFSTPIIYREVPRAPEDVLISLRSNDRFAYDSGAMLLILSSNNKPAAELAAKSKYFLGSNHRTSEAIKPKSAAILSTIAATFCSIIIEQIFTTPTKPYKKIHILFIFLEILTSFSSLL